MKNSKEEATKTQVYVALKSYLASIGNISHLSFIERLYEGNYRGPLINRNLEEENDLETKSLRREVDIYRLKEKEVDYSVTASAQTRQLRFWNAIQSYKRDIRIRSSASSSDKYYEQRAVLHMILGEFRKSYVLAKKANNYELMTVLSFMNSEFRNIIEILDDVIMQIENTPITVVTHMELFYIIGFSFLASWDLKKDDNELFEEFMSCLEDEKDKPLRDLMMNFKNHQYKAVIEGFNSMSPMGYISMYMQPSFSRLKNEINKNIVSHLLSSYVSMAVSEIKENTGISAIELPEIICECISTNKLSGKYDYVERKFQASQNDEIIEEQEIIDNSIIVKSMIEVGYWKSELFERMRKVINSKEVEN
ncbi:hypothetical protein TVAG_083150 [Trichomonas vaginalis G3]|uniref:PCI domain-containing protein n=1 Tax=Trichomonas vaginalis (strain ATCC PRA-98 / G3) TaxID=412133 RepID=A2DM42_TRIV3|nr:hypothetical protein TVAGG3_0984220 [Trichomonas vaginalis G3]EAY18462.1 hypothetical protein TVAG_083150 [Trichomonas vaginalis G3]KAI5489549.1 hypothetical protein TVAGG3_0984220 [Trichomonas vaginalis G3]|eukprot:XP_001579448.1 hypothetical protein [Trichomonas vaginalis G3]